MNRRLIAVAILAATLLSGCDLSQGRTYVSAMPHKEDSVKTEANTITAVNYRELRKALLNLVASGHESGIIDVKDYNQDDIFTDMEKAASYTTQEDPIGSYAVEEITFEVGSNSGKPAVAVSIVYLHGRTELKQVQKVEKMVDAASAIGEALNRCDPGLVLYIDEFQDTDFAQLVEDYADWHPDKVMELPQVAVSIYPQEGSSERVVELKFTYQTSRETLRSMQDRVGQFFTSALLYVIGDSDEQTKFSQLYSFLMERFEYKIETSLTPSYSLLRHGVGDSEAFAGVYAAMCRQVDLDCRVVSGTKNGESWYWNIIRIEDQYYHIDLLDCTETGLFYGKSDDQMQGYVWDYSAFPVCLAGQG